MIIRIYLDIDQPDGFFESIIIPSDSEVYYRRRSYSYEFERMPRSHGFWRYMYAFPPYDWKRYATPAEAFPDKPFVGIRCDDYFLKHDNDLLYEIERVARDKIKINYDYDDD